ncbi:hypothetical protein V1520DRAFT_9193 [Lipomyces starkeyi]|uniref:Secreted protein n=1 Tax=Lipomyces starkeyi NRRL Y-11557 TaxID=675824 RepID=A0A1E3Q736_LIPST|nr:hypothetical protein LIPSTDRAFT_263289 [Lipomyces starkeyi NRRL Y-11557]
MRLLPLILLLWFRPSTKKPYCCEAAFHYSPPEQQAASRCRRVIAAFELLFHPVGCSRSIRWSDLPLKILYSSNLTINLTLPVLDRDDMD